MLEYLEGRDLTAALALPTPAGFFIRAASGVAEGMAYLHGQGVMHRDLKVRLRARARAWVRLRLRVGVRLRLRAWVRLG